MYKVNLKIFWHLAHDTLSGGYLRPRFSTQFRIIKTDEMKDYSTKLRVVRIIEWTNNSKIANFWRQTLIFQIEKILKFLNFPIWIILRTSSLKNTQNFQFGKFQKFRKLKKNSILKIPKICNVANSKNLHFLKYKKFPKFFNFKKYHISKIV